EPGLYGGFGDREVNDLLGVDGEHEYALALLALGKVGTVPARGPSQEASLGRSPDWDSPSPGTVPSYPLAEAAHEASSFSDPDEVREWRSEPPTAAGGGARKPTRRGHAPAAPCPGAAPTRGP